MSQIITVTFAEGQREAIAAQPLEQWAYGQTLQFEGLDLPQAYRVDFSNFEYCGASIPRVGGPNGVAVPVEVLTSGRNVYAFIWVQDETSGARYRRATVRVVPGPEPDTDESPEEQSAVTEAINALNAAAEAIPEQVNAAVEEAVSSGTFADVFWITLGLTTADEIYAANAAGKICLMQASPDVLYYLTWCGEVRNLGPSGVVLEKQAILTAWDGDEKTTIRVMHETWSSPSTVKFARTASPTFTGAPKAPTVEAGTNNTQIATTAFVNAAIQAALEGFTPGQTISEELKQALLQLARKAAYIDAQGETYYQDLYDALYPPAVLASIQAAFAQGSTVIYNTDSLDVLKPLLTVTAVYDDGSTETVPAADYTLSGTLAAGFSTITASYQGKTATFQVTVTAAPMAFPVTNNLTGCSTSNSAAATMENEPYSAVITPAAGYTLAGASVLITMAGSNITASAYSSGVINIAAVTGELVISIVAQEIALSSISAVYTQSGVVYNTDTLDSLKADLVVTAAYSDSSTQTVPAADYTLSGTLTVGTSIITVSYQGKTTTFSVVVTEQPTLSSITAVYDQSGTVYDTDTLDSLKADLVVTAVYSDSSTQTVPAADYTLSGTLTVGTSTITVSYSGKTTTFSVTVTAHVVNGWLYHFDQSLISSGTEDFGFQGVQEYTAGRLGNDWAYYHRVATPGDTATDPFGIYALNLITAPNFSGDFTISFWMATQEANHFHPFTYGIYGNGNTPSSRYFSGGITTDNSAWSISQSSATNKYAGICMWALQSTGKFTISFHNAELTASSQVIMTIPSSFDTTQWHHYALTRKGTTVRFFIDGQLVWHATASYSTIYAANQICVGNLFKQTSATAQQLDPVSRGEKIQDLYIAESCKWDAAFDPATITY